MEIARTSAHDAFIDACNILTRAMRRSGEEASWRDTLGDDRKVIGDFACHLHSLLNSTSSNGLSLFTKPNRGENRPGVRRKKVFPVFRKPPIHPQNATPVQFLMRTLWQTGKTLTFVTPHCH
jgi:hypothetical protein